MATSGQLAQTLSTILGIPLGTVNFYGQALRDAGLLTKGGRGPAAAKMTREDAINWLVALCAAETSRAAPAVVKHTLAATLDRIESQGPGEIDGDLLYPRAKSVSELMGALFEDEAAHRLGPILLDLDFRISVSEVRLTATRFSGDDFGHGWRLWMLFLPGVQTRRVLPDEELLRHALASRITKIGKGVIEAINETLQGT